MGYKISSGKVPCKDCQERHLHCHSECQRYIEWAAKQRIVTAKEREQWLINGLIRDGQARRYRDIRNGHKGRVKKA